MLVVSASYVPSFIGPCAHFSVSFLVVNSCCMCIIQAPSLCLFIIEGSVVTNMYYWHSSSYNDSFL